MHKSNKDNENDENVKDLVKRLENIIFDSIRELEHLHDTMGAILNSVHPLLLPKVEKQWRLDAIEKSIIQDIGIIEQGSKHYNNEAMRIKQEKDTKILTTFALLSVVIVIGTIVSIDKDKVLWLDAWIFVLCSASVIGFIILFFTKHLSLHDFTKKITKGFLKR
jgi:hypothetical protein